MKAHFILVPLAVLAVAVFGSWLTGGGMDWYKTIKLPSWTPPGSLIGAVWTIIFILTAVAAILFWNKAAHGSRFSWVVAIFILNGVLNVLWSYLFFNRHLLGTAISEAGLLDLSVIGLIALIWPISRVASVLIMPYAGWVTFATYLTYTVWNLNK
jgi:tryptophan-rich sensory protein